jgi:hypothetical protein
MKVYNFKIILHAAKKPIKAGIFSRKSRSKAGKLPDFLR